MPRAGRLVPVPEERARRTGIERLPPETRQTLRELALFLPRLVVLLKRLLTDRRVPTRSKFIVGGTVAYLLSPIDVIPDFVPGLGQLDDIVIALLALHSILNHVDEDVILELWDGDEDQLNMVRQGVAAIAGLLPGDWEKRV